MVPCVVILKIKGMLISRLTALFLFPPVAEEAIDHQGTPGGEDNKQLQDVGHVRLLLSTSMPPIKNAIPTTSTITRILQLGLAGSKADTEDQKQ